MSESQPSFSDVGYTRRSRVPKWEELLKQIDAVVPWAEWVTVIEPHVTRGSPAPRNQPITLVGIHQLQRAFTDRNPTLHPRQVRVVDDAGCRSTP